MDAGQRYEPLETDLDPHGAVTSIAVGSADPDVAVAVLSDIGGRREPARLLATDDGGATWTDVTGDLPAAPVNEVVSLPGGDLLAASDVGVFLSEDGSRWFSLGQGLPAVPILDLRYRDGVVTAATFGHGPQRLELP